MFNSWTTRLTVQATGVFLGRDFETLCFFRLLACHEGIVVFNAEIKEALALQIRLALGTDTCVQHVLNAQNRPVFCFRVDPECLSTLSWR